MAAERGPSASRGAGEEVRAGKQSTGEPAANWQAFGVMLRVIWGTPVGGLPRIVAGEARESPARTACLRS